MDANQLKDLVQRYETSKEYIENEEAAKMGLVVPFIRLLGYDPNLPKEVRPEYAAPFVQGDGKKQPDRMDYAIFDVTGAKPLMVFETKALGSDIVFKSNQLARYIAQMPELHFGVITDGCHYLFFGDLENQNVMDKDPFFTFALDDIKTDWGKVAAFLTKFSRDSFNAGTLIIDAENARYRQAMIEKLARVLKAPGEDESFMQWLTADIYKGRRTEAVRVRLGEVARDSIEPTLLRVMSNDFIERLREGLQRTLDSDKDKAGNSSIPKESVVAKADEKPASEDPLPGSAIVTTDEELEFFRIVREICVKSGSIAETILYRDTINYFNVSYSKPTHWFVRFFGDTKRKNITTLVPVEEATQLAKGFEIEQSPEAFGASRIYINDVAQAWDLKLLLARSLEILQAQKNGSDSTNTVIV
jgi:predicted type IV restriction endonuclease